MLIVQKYGGTSLEDAGRIMAAAKRAAELARKSAAGYVLFFGTVQPNVYAIHMLWGDCCVKLHKYSEAAKAYSQALETAKQVFTQGSVQIAEAEQKLQNVNAV